MKTLIVLLVLFFTFKAYSQGDLTLNLHFFDNSPSGNLSIIQFGLDSLATDSIDENLGEWEWPPDLCGGWGSSICAGFMIPPVGSGGSTFCMRDFRFGIPPYNLQANYLIHFQPVTDVMYIAWSLPGGATGLLQDPFGGIFVNVTMVDSNIYQVPSNVLSWLDDLFMTITYDNVVPVELTSFTASVLQNEKAVQLNWITATETNNSGFEILRFAQNDNEWETIGFVPGFGTITEQKSYCFTDENVTTGTYKYLLKQIDFDGSFTYSNEIEVVVDFTPEEFVLYQNYPNPFNPNTVISYQLPLKSNVTLKVYDLLGNEVATLVNEEKQPGVYEVEFNSRVGHSGEVRNLTSGIYFYQLKAEGFIQTKKMILAK
jgi:hypothetical protein